MVGFSVVFITTCQRHIINIHVCSGYSLVHICLRSFILLYGCVYSMYIIISYVKDIIISVFLPSWKSSREPLEEGGDPRADACNLPLYDTTCLAACTKFCRAFCSHVWIDPHKEPFNGKKAALISKLKHTLQQSPICFCNCSQAITYISFLNGVSFNGVKYLPLYHLQCDGRWLLILKVENVVWRKEDSKGAGKVMHLLRLIKYLALQTDHPAACRHEIIP